MTWIDFLDDAWLERSAGLIRVWTEPRKLRREPLVAPEHPWEGNACYLYGSVLYDEQAGQWRMWYQTFTHGLPYGQRTGVCLAVSDDGLAWTKPRLGLFPGERWRDGNAVLVSNGIGDLFSPSVLLDPDAPPEQRFKMMYWDFGARARGGFAASSGDGVRWTKWSAEPVWESRRGDILENVLSVCLDPFASGYLAFHQSVAGQSYPRCAALRRSRDFASWSERELVLVPEGPPDAREFYGLSAFPWRGRLLGSLLLFDPAAQTIQPHLAWSRDGGSWSWRRDGPFIALGSPGDFDDHLILPVNTPARHGDETWFYYGAFDRGHDTLEKTGAIGAAALPADRYCGLRAQGRGQLTTALFEPRGWELLVDAQLESGSLQVEALQPDGEALAGYSASESTLRPGPQGLLRCAWRGAGSLPAAPCRLRLSLERGTLYGLELRDER